ncbi:MAG: hypothetical protein ACRCYU_15665 [Nocardioides sp.]
MRAFRGRVKSGRWLAGLVVVPVAIASMVGLAIVADRWAPNPTLSSAAPEAVVVPVEQADARRSYEVSLKAELAARRVVRSRASGIVTGIAVRAGTTVDAGDRLVSLDDRPVVAFVGSAPLVRDLVPGDSGPDVLRLARFLAATGRLSGEPTDYFGVATAVAVRDFNADLGQTAAGSAFLASTVSWIGPSSMPVGGVAVRVGDRVSVDSVLLRGRLRLARVVVAEPANGVPASDGGYALSVGDVTVPYRQGSGQIDGQKALAGLEKRFADDREAAGTLRAELAMPVLRVPVTSVIVDAGGGTCVYPDVGESPVEVQVIGGELGVADLRPIAALDRVLANPGQVLDALSCDS